jgi:hypothetical protein
MRIPFIWCPAPSAGVAPAVVEEPVGQLDLAPTFCRVAGAPIPEWMQGAPLPTAPGSGRERVLTEWDSQFAQVGMHLRTIYRDGCICTVQADHGSAGWDLALDRRGPSLRPDATHGRRAGRRAGRPYQWRNLWNSRGAPPCAPTWSPTCATTCRHRARAAAGRGASLTLLRRTGCG